MPEVIVFGWTLDDFAELRLMPDAALASTTHAEAPTGGETAKAATQGAGRHQHFCAAC